MYHNNKADAVIVLACGLWLNFSFLVFKHQISNLVQLKGPVFKI